MANRSTPTTATPGAESEVADDGRRVRDALVRQAQEGDERAARTLYEENRARIYRHLARYLGATADADDAVQQVFIQAFRNLRKFDFRSDFRAWLHGIAMNIALNSMRSRQRNNRAMATLAGEMAERVPPAIRDPEQRVAVAQRAARLQLAVEKLPVKGRVAFSLYYFEQLKLGEVARRVGASPDTTWTRIKRARARVVELLSETTGSDDGVEL